MSSSRVYLVSAPYPSGISWLFNVLLELRVKVQGTSIPCSWYRTAHGFSLNASARQSYQVQVPTCYHRQYFEFEPNLTVESDHRLAFARFQQDKAILYVRDPRDAVYSDYRRCFPGQLSFLDMLRQIDFFMKNTGGLQSGVRGLFHLPPAEFWAYFNSFWLGMQAFMPLMVIRHEDAKVRPIETTEKVLQFMGLTRTSEEIGTATEKSTFAKAREVAEKLAETTSGASLRHTRKGQYGEWKEVMSPAELACFSGPAREVMELLGYDTSRIPNYAGEGVLESDVESSITANPAAKAKIDEALAYLSKGSAADSERAFWQSLALVETDPIAYFHVSNLITSLRWTRTIFSDALCSSLPARTAFGHFVRLNRRFGRNAHVQYALASNVKYFPAELLARTDDLNLFYRNRSHQHAGPTKAGQDVIDTGRFHAIKKEPEAQTYIEVIRRIRTLCQNGQTQEAQAQVEQALQAYPFTAELHDLHGDVLKQACNFNSAVLAYERTTFLDPYLTETNIKEAEIFWAARQRDKAIHLLYDALTWSLDDPRALDVLGGLLEENGDFQRAMEVRLNHGEADPENPSLWIRLASVSLKAGVKDRIDLYLQKAFALAPADIAVANSLTALYWNSNRPAEALKCAEHALELDPDDKIARENHEVIRKLVGTTSPPTT